MKKIKKIEGKLLLFLVAAIGILCAGFIIIGCGSSQSGLKVADPHAGAFGLDFNGAACPKVPCLVAFESTSFASERSIGNTPITLEAWIKPKVDSSATIFSRMGSRGASLSVTSTAGAVTPKFTIRRVVASPSATPPTSTAEYIISSSVDVPLDSWAHVAGVLTNVDHTGAHTSCTGYEGDPWHIDIYVDGVFTGCARTFDGTTLAGDPDLTADADAYAHNPADNTFGVAFASGVIDEVRMWTTARTESQINTCKGREIGPDSGDCGRVGTGLIAYQRFNEGTGYSVADFSGIGSGTKEYPDPDATGEFLHWETGWVAGAQVSGVPITPAD